MMNENEKIKELEKEVERLKPLVSEEKLLESIFGEDKKTWRGHKLIWCPLCEVVAIKLKCCGNLSCNGSGCEICCGENKDSTDFSKLTKHCVEDYLTKEEENVYQKACFLKNHILESLAAGFNEINWKYLHESGNLCPADYKLFDELKEFKNESL